MFEAAIVGFQSVAGGMDISGIPVIIDESDYTGVKIAAQSLSEDLEKVTCKCAPILYTVEARKFDRVVILGSLQNSTTMRRLVDAGKVDASEIEHKWEAFMSCIIDRPFDGVDKALVLAGSDKRGTMFAAYTLCEQIGVSPWYWWADVPVRKRKELYALPGITRQGDPTIKFRGIFINDEAPSLTSWVLEKFGPKYNSEFYKRVYDLLLRLKANFLWPAMWSGYPPPGSSFFEDDPLNQKLADDYGIVVGTSHHEPMQRAMIEWFNTNQGSWSWIVNEEPIRKHFREGIERAKRYESYVTMGIRGDGDLEMDVEDPQAVLTDVIAYQRKVIKEVHGDETSIKQLWALYKEVQEYYENGLKIPDDVTLLFADDNFGTIRRLPYGTELQRSGGAGLYYHLEYVGLPRSYKWLNSNTCGKIYQQLSSAVQQKADQIWVINVGDIKPMESPLTYIMALAWNINCTSSTTVPQFLEAYALREFGAKYSSRISNLLLRHDRLVALRRHEHIEPETYSVINYGEAQTIIAKFSELAQDAGEIYKLLPQDLQPAFFQIVLHPVKASYIYSNIRFCQALNSLYGLQRRNTTNKLADKVIGLFNEDFNLSEEYHTILGGKWNNLMRQPHYGFGNTWHAPSRDLITGLSYVQLRQDSSPFVGQMGVAVEGHPGVRPGRTNEESDRTRPSRRELLPGVTLPPMDRYGADKRFFELFARGTKELHWAVEVRCPWINLSETSGILDLGGDDHLVTIAVDWNSVPESFDEVVPIEIRSSDGDYEQLHLPLTGRRVPGNFHGFVETDGHISMHAVHVTLDAGEPSPFDIYYEHHPYIGRTCDGGVSLNRDNDMDVPYLHYSTYCFSSGPEATATLYFTTILDTNPARPISYDVGFGDVTHQNCQLLEKEDGSDLPNGWADAAQDCVWIRKHRFRSIGNEVQQLRYKPNCRGLMLEKIVLDLGGVRESYLGPPESYIV